MRVALLEDEADSVEMVGDAIKNMGWQMKWFPTGERLLNEFRTCDFDVLVADIYLEFEGHTGIDIIRQLRRHGIGVPVLMLTRFPIRFEEPQALDAGADHYLEKPFKQEVLIARLKAMHRRVNLDDASVAYAGLLSVSLLHEKAYWDGRHVKLTPRSFAILAALVCARGEVVSYEALWRAGWPKLNYEVCIGHVHAGIATLRSELKPALKSKKVIQAVPRQGYRIDLEAASSL